MTDEEWAIMQMVAAYPNGLTIGEITGKVHGHVDTHGMRVLNVLHQLGGFGLVNVRRDGNGETWLRDGHRVYLPTETLVELVTSGRPE